ncbi:MAG: hypothetical protein WC073_12950 [Sterolibacterium sp.]
MYPTESTYETEIEIGTLILDALGNICSCGSAAERVFGGNLTGYEGRSISSLIPGFVMSNTSQSYCVRYLAHLCADAGWRRSDAIDIQGHRFLIEFNLSLVETKAQGVFLLNVRRPRVSR